MARKKHKKIVKNQIELNSEDFTMTDLDAEEIDEATIFTQPSNLNQELYTLLTFNEVEKVALSLLHERKVILDLNQLSKHEKQRTLTFMSGIVFALDGYITKLESETYEVEIKH